MTHEVSHTSVADHLSLFMPLNAQLYQLYVCLSIHFCVFRCLEKVSPSVLPYFTTTAEMLIKDKGALEVVSAALAYISGVTEIKSRSLLSSQPVRTFGCSMI